MESRLRIFLLGTLFALVSPSIAAEPPAAETKVDPNQSVSQSQDQSNKDIIQQDPVIQPDVKRREVTESDINTENFELEAFLGLLSIEDYGSGPVYGFRLDYHITEDLFLQGAIGQAQAGSTAFSRLGGGTALAGEDGDYTYYNIAIAYNLLPGEAFVTRDSAFNTSFYLLAGAGNTEFAGDDHFTITWGGGYVITATSWLSVHMDFRDHMFSIDTTGEDKTSHNFEVSFSLAYYF